MDLQDQAGTWTYKAQMHTARAAFGCTLGADNRIYVFGGITTFGFIADCEAYDPNEDAWRHILRLPMPIGQTAAVTSNDGKILLIGGVTTGAIPLSSTILYDPGSKAYSTLAPLPTETLGCAFSVMGRKGAVYMLSSSEAGSFMHSYDLEGDQWRKLDLQIPSPPSSPCCVDDEKGFVYLVGGSDQSGPSSLAYRLDVAMGVWAAMPNMLHARRGHGLAIGGDARIYAYGGFDIHDVSLGSCEAYDATAESWTEVASMNMPREDFGCVSDREGRIYAIGGLIDIPSRVLTLNSLECYQTFSKRTKSFGAVVHLEDLPSQTTASNEI